MGHPIDHPAPFAPKGEAPSCLRETLEKIAQQPCYLSLVTCPNVGTGEDTDGDTPLAYAEYCGPCMARAALSAPPPPEPVSEQVEALQHEQDRLCALLGGGCQRHEIHARVSALLDKVSLAEEALPEGFRVDAEHSLAECVARLSEANAVLDRRSRAAYWTGWHEATAKAREDCAP